MHFHQDLLAICDAYGARVLQASPDDRFIGSPPLAFTFGLGGLVLFPMRIGAAMVLPEKAAPPDLDRRDRAPQGERLLHRADRLSRHAGQAGRPRHRLAAHLRLGRRDAAEGDLRGLAGERPASR